MFVSSDREESAFDEYFASMGNFAAVPFTARNKKESLSSAFGVRGIPSLVLLDGSGALIDLNVRGSHRSYL